MIEAQLPPEWRELADRMRLIRDYSPHMNTKIKDMGDLLRIVLHYVAGSSLRMTAALASVSGVVVLTSVALHKWMKKLGPYLAALLQRMVGSAIYSWICAKLLLQQIAYKIATSTVAFLPTAAPARPARRAGSARASEGLGGRRAP